MAGLGRGQVVTAARRIREMSAMIMQKSHSKKSGIGVRRPKSLKLRSGGRGKNGFVHVTKAGTVSEIRRTLGIKPWHIRNVRHAFKMAGVEV